MKAFSVILPAAGESRRFRGQGNEKKPFALLAGKPVWVQTVLRFTARPDVGEIILLHAPGDRDFFKRELNAQFGSFKIPIRPVEGGKERVDSVANGLVAASPYFDFVAIHDIARPCVSDAAVTKLFKAVRETSAVIPAVPIFGTIKRGENGKIIETVPRENLWEAQTPQVFSRELILEAYAKRVGLVPTDDAQLVERLPHPVALLPGERTNIKITDPEDLELAEIFFARISAKQKRAASEVGTTT